MSVSSRLEGWSVPRVPDIRDANLIEARPSLSSFTRWWNALPIGWPVACPLGTGSTARSYISLLRSKIWLPIFKVLSLLSGFVSALCALTSWLLPICSKLTQNCSKIC